jgi:peptide/nickel transport system permease protein
MFRLIAQRFCSACFTLVFIAVVVFGAVELMPGNACTAYLGRDAVGVKLENCETRLGLKRPAIERFGDWAIGALQGDLGVSVQRGKPITEMIGWRLRNTIVLSAIALLFGVPLAILLGVIAGLNKDRKLDFALSAGAIFAMTLPEFVSSTIFILIFSVSLGWASGIVTIGYKAPIWELIGSSVLPATTLTLVLTAHILRMVRASVIEVLESDYVLMARLKGVPYRRIILRHVLPNSLLPAISVIGLTVAWLLGGVVTVESVYNYPGLGRMVVDAVSDRDIPLVQAITLLICSVYILVNLLTDILAMLLNPRLRTYRA